ncbi:UNVERIFIED_CONTAM: hypothetical protein FKN15_026714 [Acipenser sinensis]
MDPAALNTMMEAQARRHEETLAAVMERMNAMFLAANQRREPVAEPAVAPPKPKVPLRIAWGCQPLRIAWGCLLLRIAAGSTVAGTPPRGAAGHEEGGGGPETCPHCGSFAAGDRGGGPETFSHCSSFAAGDRGGGPETCSHCSFFAAGSTVVRAPPRGATGYEERGRGQETSIPCSNFAAGVDQHAVSRATTRRGADSIASHGPTEASLPSPRFCPGLLGF